MTTESTPKAAYTPALDRRYTMHIEPTRTMRARDALWEHSIQVALPASYYDSVCTYPAIWITDASAYFGAAVDLIQGLAILRIIPEMIVIGVGSDRSLPLGEFSRRRNYDFTPTDEVYYDGLGGQALRQAGAASGPVLAGGAPGFCSFLVEDVRRALAAEYRMNPDDHAIFGHSGGGLFVGYALFAFPGAFAKYICGSPSLNSGNYEIFKLEERYAASHRDLRARVFFGAGEREIDDPGCAAWSIVGSMVRLAETLRLRNYPSLRVSSRVLAGETHFPAALSILSWGVRTLWSEQS